jgi:hypothetical protein
VRIIHKRIEKFRKLIVKQSKKTIEHGEEIRKNKRL